MAPGLVFAQGTNWRQRGDRFEGVITSRDISGGYFSLVGVHLEGQGELRRDSDRLSIVFWQPSAQKLKVKVWDPDSNYWMVPTRRNYEGGRQVFTWPTTEVLKPLGLNYGKLKVLVTDSAETVVYPSALVSQLSNAGTKSYRFVFDSKGGVQLDGRIIRETGGQPQLLKQFRVIENYPGTVHIRWDGRDRSGNPVAAGLLRLQLEGDIYLSDSEDYITSDIQFQHHD
jgi:hypothetical protein